MRAQLHRASFSAAVVVPVLTSTAVLHPGGGGEVHYCRFITVQCVRCADGMPPAFGRCGGGCIAVDVRGSGAALIKKEGIFVPFTVLQWGWKTLSTVPIQKKNKGQAFHRSGRPHKKQSDSVKHVSGFRFIASSPRSLHFLIFLFHFIALFAFCSGKVLPPRTRPAEVHHRVALRGMMREGPYTVGRRISLLV